MWSYARERIPIESFLEGSQVPPEMIEQEQLLSWAQFLIITQNFFLHFGARDDVLFELCRQQVDLPGYEIAATFGGLFASPRTLYRAAARWFSPWTFPCVFPNTLNEVNKGLYLLDIQLKTGFTPSPHFFILNRAMIATCT